MPSMRGEPPKGFAHCRRNMAEARPCAALEEIETALGVHPAYLSNYLIILYE
jgi:hypothetical protein